MPGSRPKRVSFQTVGCRLNQYETERMAAALLPYGFRRVARGEIADLYIINTCTVTHRADSSSRYLIHRAARENPNAAVVVAGCYVDNDPELIAGMDEVDVIISNNEKEHITRILPRYLPDLFTREPDSTYPAGIASFEHCNRAWLKVSDGCNQGCSFCILPMVRGKQRNRSAREVIEEIGGLVQAGFNEVVLTGLHLGLYEDSAGRPPVRSLAHLCRRILASTDLRRIRLSSIEPQTVGDELLNVCADSDGRICRHVHMPLQSGSSRILKLMRRPYEPAMYMERVAAIKETKPGTIVGADLIVGFPGETDEDFDQSRRLVESGLIDYLHVFSYSDRAGTAASAYTGKVSPRVIKERNSILTGISKRLRAESHRRQVGQILEVIPEHKRPEKADFWGISDNYIRVRLPRDFEGGRQIIRVRVTTATDEHVEGELLR